MGNLKKIKKWAQNGGDEKTRPFLKNGDAKNKKKGPTPCGREKYQILFKKKKMGRKWALGKNPPFSKNWRKKKKKGGPPPFFFFEAHF